MERWEYKTTVLAADINREDVQATVADLFRGRRPPKPLPELLIPSLNAFGEEGWELVSLEPVAVADDDPAAPGARPALYLAVFKRRKV